nr:hypothetical protein [Tundra vole stool-associated circular virus]
MEFGNFNKLKFFFYLQMLSSLSVSFNNTSKNNFLEVPHKEETTRGNF